MEIRACLFDVFGTVVDWRTSVSRDLAALDSVALVPANEPESVIRNP